MNYSLLISDSLLCFGIYIAIFITITVIYFIYSLLLLKKENRKAVTKKILTQSLMISYIVFLFIISFSSMFRIGFSTAETNFIPFNFSTTISRRALYSQILLYVPLGFLIVPNFTKYKEFYFLIPIIMITIIKIVESLQYKRIFNINEVIFNIIGSLVGIGLFYLINLVFKKRLLKE